MSSVKKTVFVSTGGTGGHVYPALTLADTLVKHGYKVVLMIDKRVLNLVPQDSNPFALYVLNIRRGRSGLGGKFLYYFSLMKQAFRATLYMHRAKPDLVIGFGGYASLPITFASMLLNRPLFLHEQNTVLGTANALTARFAKKLFTSFPETESIAEKDRQKTEYVGYPARFGFKRLKASAYAPQLLQEHIEILIYSGSQGAEFFDETITQALTLLPYELKRRIHVTQQVRFKNTKRVAEAYKKSGIKASLSNYLSVMEEHLQKAHFVIARSGAGTVFELLETATPALLVPLPSAKANHQNKNALFLKDLNGAAILDQEKASVQECARIIKNLLIQEKVLQHMHECLVAVPRQKATQKMIKSIDHFLKD